MGVSLSILHHREPLDGKYTQAVRFRKVIFTSYPVLDQNLPLSFLVSSILFFCECSRKLNDNNDKSILVSSIYA